MIGADSNISCRDRDLAQHRALAISASWTAIARIDAHMNNENMFTPAISCLSGPSPGMSPYIACPHACHLRSSEVGDLSLLSLVRLRIIFGNGNTDLPTSLLGLAKFAPSLSKTTTCLTVNDHTGGTHTNRTSVAVYPLPQPRSIQQVISIIIDLGICYLLEMLLLSFSSCHAPQPHMPSAV